MNIDEIAGYTNRLVKGTATPEEHSHFFKHAFPATGPDPDFPELTYPLVDELVTWNIGEHANTHFEEKDAAEDARFKANLQEELFGASPAQLFYDRRLKAQTAISANDIVIRSVSPERALQIVQKREELKMEYRVGAREMWQAVLKNSAPPTFGFDGFLKVNELLTKASEDESTLNPLTHLYHPLSDEYFYLLSTDKISQFNERGITDRSEMAQVCYAENQALVAFFPQHWKTLVEQERAKQSNRNAESKLANETYAGSKSEEMVWKRHQRRAQVRGQLGCLYADPNPYDELRHLAILSVRETEWWLYQVRAQKDLDVCAKASLTARAHSKNALQLLKAVDALEQRQYKEGQSIDALDVRCAQQEELVNLRVKYLQSSINQQLERPPI